MISDSFEPKEVDGVVYEVDCAMITLGAVEVSMYNLNVRCIKYGSPTNTIKQTPVPTLLLRRPKRVLRMELSKSTTLSTPSVFSQPSLTRRPTSAILRVCSSHFRSSDICWLLIVLGYMKTVKSKLKEKNAPEEEITAFEKGAATYAKKIVSNFKDYDFYVGESMDPDGM